jgi:hypothetical protein
MKFIKIIIFSFFSGVLSKDCGPEQLKSCKKFLNNNKDISFCENQIGDHFCCDIPHHNSVAVYDKIGVCMKDNDNDKTCKENTDKNCSEFVKIHDKIEMCAIIGKYYNEDKVICYTLGGYDYSYN